MTERPASPTAASGPAPAKLALFDNPPASHDLSRRSVSVEGLGTYELFIATPKQSGADRPILYMLDGNAAFDAFTSDMLETVPDLTLIGVGYPTDLRFDVVRRNHDYTPPLDDTYPKPDPARPERTIGGADSFLTALSGAIRDAVEAGLPLPTKRYLWGHSLAGLCALYGMLTRTNDFDGYIAASPSLWWGDEFLLRLQAKARSPETRSLIMLGDSEKRSSPTGPHWDGPAPHTLQFVEALRAQGNDSQLEIFAGSGHAATFSQSLPFALAFHAA